MRIQDYNRIILVGSGGSGKSWMAKKIAEITGYPLTHLDNDLWRPGWVKTPKDEWVAVQEKLISGERWIIDGNYKGSLEIRFAAADLVIFLDLPRWLCAWRAIRRHGTQRPDMRPDVVEGSIFRKDFMEFLGFIWNFRKDTTPRILALHEKYPGVAFMHVRTAREAKNIAKQAGM